MSLNPNTFIRIFIVIFVLLMIEIAYKVYEHVIFVQDQRKQLIQNFYDPNLDNESYVDILDAKFLKRKKIRRRIVDIKSEIRRINLRQKVYNSQYLYKVTNITHIIVIQVHSNLFLFRQLLQSLKKAHSIADTLLIFSHDYFDTKINNAARGVNFARYMQIFYPYSIQLHPNVYPGVRSCKDSSMCNASSLRDPVAAQKKHHWWWQANQIFDHLEVTANYTGNVLFLNEDNYVAEDFLVILRLLEKSRTVHCPVCEMISLGAHEPDVYLYNKKNAVIILEIWGKRMPKLGIAFGKDTWRSVKSWGEDFCSYNDYTWDNCLKYVGSQHMDSNFFLTTIDAPRVFSVETCESKDTSCKPEYKVDEVKSFLEMVSSHLFPVVLVLRIAAGENYAVKPVGSFSDQRDRELCNHFTNNNVWF